MDNVKYYLNPIRRLGLRKYSLFFPFIVTIVAVLILEIIFVYLLQNPDAIGLFAIFIFIALIIYFSFRDGVRGGFITTGLTIAYYGYIISTRTPPEERLIGYETSAALGVLYLLIAFTIGSLKQKIDTLIEQESDEKKRLQAIIQQLPVGVLVVNKHGKLLLSNKQLENILGKNIKKDTSATHDYTITGLKNGNDKHLTPSQMPIAQTLVTGRPVIKKEFTIDRADGKSLHLQISASAIHNKRGKIVAAASIIHDITEQKMMEERKDDFVNMASHELKTPITSMKLYIESLSRRIKQYDDERANKTIASIEYQTERLQELVSDLLDVSRLQTGKLRFNKEVVNLTAVIKDTIEELEGTTRQQTISFTHKAAVRVEADKFRIYQVLTNLITNAIKYSPAGSNIHIAMKRNDESVIVSVKDSGIGISKEQLKRIFDRLYQVTDSKEKTFPGLGMGLYISKEIVKRHSGKIWVESEKEVGSTFSFSLPLRAKHGKKSSK